MVSDAVITVIATSITTITTSVISAMVMVRKVHHRVQKENAKQTEEIKKDIEASGLSRGSRPVALSIHTAVEPEARKRHAIP